MILEALSHLIASEELSIAESEYMIKVTEEDEKVELQEKIRKTLSTYIKNPQDLDKCTDKMLNYADSSEYEVHDVFSQNVKPYESNKYLPWQDSIMQPANNLSLATTISTVGINLPKAPAYSPTGASKVSEESSNSDTQEQARNSPRKSTSRGNRLSIRNPLGAKPRDSMMSQRSSIGEKIIIPKLHTGYYDSTDKKNEIENHASWISFILFEETKKIERLALLEKDDVEDLSLDLKKRSTMINVATTTNTHKNFTKKDKDFEDNFIEFGKRKYDRRRASSVIQKIHSPLPKGLIECMKQFKTWNFDSFMLNELTSRNPLSFFMQYLFQAYSLDEKLDFDKVKYKAFFYEIQELYHKENHYHNAIHASDVAQGVFYFLEKGGGNLICQLDLLETTSMLIAAAVHDVDHPGLNNYYLVNTKSPMAILYNDKSVLENNHVACAFNIMRDERFDILSSLNQESQKLARNIIIKAVLGTDNAVHFEHLNHYKARRNAEDFEPHSKDKIDLLTLILHSADLSNPTRPLEYSKKWTMRVLDEFFLQGDKERELGLPISNLCDRYSINVAKSQIGFFDFFVKPFF